MYTDIQPNSARKYWNIPIMSEAATDTELILNNVDNRLEIEEEVLILPTAIAMPLTLSELSLENTNDEDDD